MLFGWLTVVVVVLGGLLVGEGECNVFCLIALDEGPGSLGYSLES